MRLQVLLLPPPFSTSIDAICGNLVRRGSEQARFTSTSPDHPRCSLLVRLRRRPMRVGAAPARLPAARPTAAPPLAPLGHRLRALDHLLRITNRVVVLCASQSTVPAWRP
eukprot:scaffold101294_cov42-Phaeocystis_antarctica.AAC.1